VKRRHPPLPAIWLVTDARNDARLDRLVARLPRGSGVIFRHYHLTDADRRARFRQVARLAGARGILIVLAGSARQARRWGADGAYGSNKILAYGPKCPRLMTVHNLREIGHARRARADAILLSPVFPTRSHPGRPALGPVRFRLLASRASEPVIPLGGMTKTGARRLRWQDWAAIDGLSA
jgi:thiamine-phosphate pyrophosphorylase